MANYRDAKETERIKTKVLVSAAKLFLSKGYTSTTIKEIASHSLISASTILYVFKTKEDILCGIVRYVLEGQFSTVKDLIKDYTDDKILFYGAETVLQLYMAESDDAVRELYNIAYSLPKSSNIIQNEITKKLEVIFKDHLPDYKTKDFYELEIASGGIIRGFMARPCDMYFTMAEKVKRYLETTLLIYRVSDEKINEVITFVSQFDFEMIAKETIVSLVEHLKESVKEVL